jgi:hypothetical protein
LLLKETTETKWEENVKSQFGLTALLLASGLTSIGQIARRVPTGPDQPMDVTVHLDPVLSPSDLIDLIRHSKLIVDATVLSLLPAVDISRKTNPVLGSPVLETDAIVSVAQVFSGSVPNNSANILIAQQGGELGKWRVTVPEDPLVARGERYILFLVPDHRASVPNPIGLPRYWAVGVWVGKLRVNGGVINVSQHVKPGLAAINGSDLPSFLDLLRSRIKQPYTDADKNAPILGAPK